MFAIKQQEVYGVWSLESTKTGDFLQKGLIKKDHRSYIHDVSSCENKA